MARTPQEIFAHHAQALGAQDLDAIVSDYSDDAVFITPSGIKHGKAGVREAFAQMLSEIPNAKWSVPTQFYAGDVLFIEWSVDADGSRVDDGIDTFVFRDGLIRTQTVRYTVRNK